MFISPDKEMLTSLFSDGSYQILVQTSICRKARAYTGNIKENSRLTDKTLKTLIVCGKHIGNFILGDMQAIVVNA